ncbi:MAG: hypothetical protein WD361_07300 [Gracilimonas sp.]
MFNQKEQNYQPEYQNLMTLIKEWDDAIEKHVQQMLDELEKVYQGNLDHK